MPNSRRSQLSTCRLCVFRGLLGSQVAVYTCIKTRAKKWSATTRLLGQYFAAIRVGPISLSQNAQLSRQWERLKALATCPATLEGEHVITPQSMACHPGTATENSDPLMRGVRCRLAPEHVVHHL